MGYWTCSEALAVFILLTWLAMNICIFVDTFFWFENSKAYSYTRAMLRSSLAWARASAACLNFNCMLILLPISRNFISFLRRACTCYRGKMRQQLDKNLTFHRLVAYMIVLHSGIHIIAHIFNMERYHQSHNKEAGELLNMLSCIGSTSNESYLNPIRTSSTDTTKEILLTISGATGIVITLALVIIVTSSTDVIKQTSYEVFWYSHHLFIVFFIGLVIHGAGRIVRGLTPQSLLVHNITYCKDQSSKWGQIQECPIPEFAGSEPGTWKWVLSPLLLYICERIIRCYRSQQAVSITKVVKHPSRVIELQMRKSGFRMEPGQYVLLQCPSVSYLEWHPFTLTSSPEEDYFSVHVRVVGDWTAAFYKTYAADDKAFDNPCKLPSIAVDGPFGSASSDVFLYQVSVCIAAGIGVTPFASVLKSIWYQCCNSNTTMKLKKVYFFWLCRSTYTFEWFADLLHSLEVQMSEGGKTNFLSYHIFLTGWDESQAAHIVLHHDDKADVITGLKHKTFYGRPNWNAEFKELVQNHTGTDIGVFYCGPKPLSTILRKLCNMHSSPYPQGVRFHYNKESY
ncbi:NADPH oxidase 3 [Protopterus annectens]|uniref:NADPH oxidase 3 n=1 Tax=Protopterus annectens TaxID=7888 RepID=UPI001CFAC8E3|nr:NADPH oxidase 3 [Protopterus annectens]